MSPAFWPRIAPGFLILLIVAAAGTFAQEPAHVLSGIVKDRDGNLLAGAKVWALSSQFLTGVDEYSRDETGANGAFSLSIPARWKEGASVSRQELGIIAHRAGQGIGGIAFYREAALPNKPLEIVLPADGSADVEIRDPQGKSLANATVKALMIQLDTIYTNVSESQAKQQAKQWGLEPRQTPWGTVAARFMVPLPAELEKVVTAKTDADGKGTLAGVTHADLYSVSIQAEAWNAAQQFNRLTLDAKDEQPLKTIQVHRLVELTGQLVGQAEDVAGKQVRLHSYAQTLAGGKVQATLQTTLTTDEQGKFQASVLEGQIVPIVAWDEQSSLRPAPPEQFVAKIGGKNHVEIPLVDAVKVFGYVRDAATGKGIAGIRVGVATWVQGKPLVTDENGRYETLSAPGTAIPLPVSDPDWIPANKTPTLSQEKIAGKEYELKPILLHRAVVLAGTVVDDGGNPVPDADVLATWLGYSHALSRDDLNSAQVKTDADGKFAIRGIDPASECRVTVAKGIAFTAAVKNTKGESPPLTLAISDKHGVKLTGRVVDAGGKPVAGARLELWHRPWAPDYYEAATAERVAIPLGNDWKTDDQGRFAVAALRPDGHYRVSLIDPRFEPSQSVWLDASRGNVPPLDDLLARKLGEHLGIVKDRSGQPVAGAKLVFLGAGKRVEGLTDGEGKFRLSPAPDGPGMLFVSKDGHRFHGRRLQTFGQPLDITLATVTEPYGEKLEIKPPALAADKRRELAIKLADELIKQIGFDLSGEQRYQILSELAKADPQAALDRIEKKRFLVPMMNDGVRFQAARTLIATAPDDALELAGEVTTFPHMQVMTYADVAAAMPAEMQGRKLEILAEAQVKAHAIKEPGFRLASLAKVAEALLDAGEKDRGKKLLLENADSARKLNKAGYDAFLRGMYAEELAQVDLAAALAMVEEINDLQEKARHLGNIAHELAALDPAEAERVLGLIPPPQSGPGVVWFPEGDAVKVCYRMARVDLPRAKKIAASLKSPHYRAHAYGVMAVALAQSDGKQARNFIRQAFDALDEASRPEADSTPTVITSGTVGGWLVTAAQQIDPELGAEMLWRLWAILPDQVGTDPQKGWQHTEGLGSAAMFLSLIDESIAREVLQRLRTSQTAPFGRSYLPAWGMVDPEEAQKQADQSPDTSRRKAQLIGAIGAGREQRLKIIHYHAGLWRIDVEDLDQ